MHYHKILGISIILILLLPLVIGEEIRWREYNGNPIFGEWIGGPKAYYPSVLYDPDEFSGHGIAARYKMWYGASGGQTGLAISDDGITWIDMSVVMSDGYHATVEYFQEGFTGVNSGDNPSGATMYYRMWYWDLDSGAPGGIYGVEAIGYTESPDGVAWYNYQPLQNGAVPIVTGTWPDWNRGSYGPCDILYNPDATNTGNNPFDYTFVMYYDGTTGGVESIGLGYSSNGIVWNGYDETGDGNADPVLEGTYIPGDWDYDFVSRATIIKTGSTYEMWYSGGIGAMNNGIGYAISFDGMHWTRDANNPLFHKDDGHPWRQGRTYCPAVIKNGNSYKMWFAGKSDDDYSIGYATGYFLNTERSSLHFLIERFFGINILNINSGGTFAVQNGIEIGTLSLEKGTHTIEIDVSNTGILKVHNVTLEVEVPGDMEVETSPERVTINKRSVGTFTITLNIPGSVEPGEYVLKIRTSGNFAQDTIYIKIYVG